MKTKSLHKVYLLCFALLLVFCGASIIEGLVASHKQQQIYAASWTSQTEMPTKTADYAGTTYTLIENEKQLAYLIENVSSYTNYRLTRNLDMSGYDWYAIGGYNSTIISYNGIFDGAGFVISNISSTTDKNYGGLFAKTNNATIQNLSLNNCSFYGKQYVGGIAGYMYRGTITKCTLTKCKYQVSRGSSSDLYIGGVVGYASGKTTISYINTESSDSVYVQISSTQTGRAYAGGIVGYVGSSSSTISNCVNNTYISTWSYPTSAYTGGIAGYSAGAISQCGNLGNVKGGDSTSSTISYTGGIVGYSSSSVTNCYTVDADINGYAKQTSSTQTITQIDKEHTFPTYDDKVSLVTMHYAHKIQTKNNSNEVGRTIYETPAYVGGIAGHASSISNCYVNENTTTSGGNKKYNDTYVATYILQAYSKFLWEKVYAYQTVWFTYNITYIQDLYYSQICGTSTATLTNNYTHQFFTDNSWSYASDGKQVITGDSNTALGDWAIDLVYGDYEVETIATQSGTGNGYSKVIISDASGFDKHKNIGFYVNYDLSNVFFETCSDYDGASTKYYALTNNISINQSRPSGYGIKTSFSKLSSLSGFDTSIWGFNNAERNNYYPYLKGNFW